MKFDEAVLLCQETYGPTVGDLIRAHDAMGDTEEDKFAQKLIQITMLVVLWRETNKPSDLKQRIQEMWNSL